MEAFAKAADLHLGFNALFALKIRSWKILHLPRQSLPFDEASAEAPCG
jgi:hypothetical protein